MEEYASDMTAARMESHQSLWKLGSCESRVWMPAKMIMFTVLLASHGASWPLRWKQLIALQQISCTQTISLSSQPLLPTQMGSKQHHIFLASSRKEEGATVLLEAMHDARACVPHADGRRDGVANGHANQVDVLRQGAQPVLGNPCE
jgi:hypothetical protein